MILVNLCIGCEKLQGYFLDRYKQSDFLACLKEINKVNVRVSTLSKKTGSKIGLISLICVTIKERVFQPHPIMGLFSVFSTLNKGAFFNFLKIDHIIKFKK